jgi:hypothetical protein
MIQHQRDGNITLYFSNFEDLQGKVMKQVYRDTYPHAYRRCRLIVLDDREVRVIVPLLAKVQERLKQVVKGLLMYGHVGLHAAVHHPRHVNLLPFTRLFLRTVSWGLRDELSH